MIVHTIRSIYYVSSVICTVHLLQCTCKSGDASAPDARTAGGWWRIIKNLQMNLNQNILTVLDAYRSLVWTEIHIQVFMITYMTLDRPCTSIIKTGCLGCQIISNSQPVTQKNVNNLQINYIKIWSPYSTLIVV